LRYLSKTVFRRCHPRQRALQNAIGADIRGRKIIRRLAGGSGEPPLASIDRRS